VVKILGPGGQHLSDYTPDYDGSGHDCGRRYKSHPDIPKQFPYDNLYIELFPTDNPRELEATFLEDYFTAFGELPPFNAVN
jgi:hypothetical protein